MPALTHSYATAVVKEILKSAIPESKPVIKKSIAPPLLTLKGRSRFSTFISNILTDAKHKRSSLQPVMIKPVVHFSPRSKGAVSTPQPVSRWKPQTKISYADIVKGLKTKADINGVEHLEKYSSEATLNSKYSLFLRLFTDIDSKDEDVDQIQELQQIKPKRKKKVHFNEVDLNCSYRFFKKDQSINCKPTTTLTITNFQYDPLSIESDLTELFNCITWNSFRIYHVEVSQMVPLRKLYVKIRGHQAASDLVLRHGIMLRRNKQHRHVKIDFTR